MTNLVNNDKRAENRAQRRLLAVADNRFGPEFEAVIRAATEQMLGQFEATGSAPNLPDDFHNRMSQIYLDMSAMLIDAFGSRILDQGKRAGLVLEVKQFDEFFQRLALEYVAQEAMRQRIAMVTETTRNQIIAQITKGQEEGLSVEETAKLISEQLPQISRVRGALIARTETHGAANFGADQAARATGLTLRKEWVSSHDHRTRDFGAGDGVIDEFSHRAADGQTVGMDQPFRIMKRDGTTEALMFPGDPVGSPGNVINCFAPWQSVSGTGLKAAMKREYIGDLVELSVAGVINLTVTLNHPVLTDKGWTAAGRIVKGDKLVYCSAGDVGAVGTSPNVAQGISSAEDIYNSAQSLVSVVGPDSGIVDLHGEVPDHDVNIVAFKGELRDAFKASGNDVFGNLCLSDTHVSKGLLLLDRMGLLSDGVSSVEPSRLIRGGSSKLALLNCLEPSCQEVALAYGGPVNPKLVEAPVDHSARDIEQFADAINRVSLSDEARNLSVDTEAYSSPSFGGGSFEFVECSGVETFHYDGPVYNFETDTGLIISQGIVNHNCRCSVAHEVVE